MLDNRNMLNRRRALALLVGTSASSVLPRAAAAADVSDAFSNGGIAFFKSLYDQNTKRDPDANVITSPPVDLLAWLQPTIGVRDRGSLAAINRFFGVSADASPAAITNQIARQTLSMFDAAGNDHVKFKADSQMWIDNKYKNPAFIDAYVRAFENGTPPEMVDFANKGPAATAAINKWVSNLTEGEIPRMLDANVPPSTQYVAASALYFNAPWGTEFDPKQTRPGNFTLANGSTQPVQMMSTGYEAHRARYLETEDYKAIAKPFGDIGEFQFVAVTPTVSTPTAMGAFISRLPQVERVLLGDRNPPQRVLIEMPRMKLGVSENFLGVLQQSLRELFSPTADFSGVAPGIQPIGMALHKIEAEFNEKGGKVVAAAAVMATRSLPPPAPVFQLNKPSLIAIVDRRGAAIMRAVVRNPATFNPG